MSSFVRTLEKRILKRKGYFRQQWSLNSEGYPVRLGKGEGLIMTPNADSTGSTMWPSVSR